MDKRYISDNKRVILITGDNSKWYEQAIFIVKKTAMAAAAHTDLIQEAEQIISNYMNGLTTHTLRLPERTPITSKPAQTVKTAPTRKQRTVFDTVVNVLIIIASGILLTYMTRGLLNL